MSSPSIQNLTPEEVVFRTNSDDKSIILVFPDRIVYVSQGMYGGYVVKSNELGFESFENVDPNVVASLLRTARAFFVEPKVGGGDMIHFVLDREAEYRSKYGEVIDVVKRELAKLSQDVVHAIKYMFSTRIYIVEYSYIEVDIELKKLAKKYAVVEVKPKPNGLKLNAKAIRIVSYCGRRGCGEETLREWRLKLAENEIVQRYMYPGGGDLRAILWKIVIEAPRELIPAPTAIPVAPATQQQSAQQPMPVLINGFLVISTLPSKALLDAHLPEIFKDIKIGTKEIKLVTGYFYNKLGTLSRKFYNFILPKYAIDAGFGYIVPKSKVAAFLAEVEELKKEYAEFEKQLKDFLLNGVIPPDLPKRAKVERRYLEIVMEYLKTHGKDEEVRKKIEALNIAGRVRIHLLPFAVDMSILYEYTDERVRKELEEEIKALKEQIIAGYRERIKEYIETLNAKLQRIVVAEARKELLEKARKEIEEMEKTAKELGIEIKELEVLKEMLTPEKVEELAVKTAEGRLRALIEF